MRRALLLVALVVGVGGPVAASLYGGFVAGDRLWPLSWLAWAPVGYLILSRRPGNRVGGALLFIGAVMGLSFGALAIAGSEAPLATRVWVELVNVLAGVPPWLGIIWLLLIYPSGMLATKWERGTAWPLVGFGALALVAFAVEPAPMPTTGMPSPLAVPALGGLARAVTGEGGFVPIPVITALSLILIVRRWRASSGVERAQYRWLFLGAFFFLLALSLGNVLPDDSNGMLIWVPAGMAIPATIGFAITRYRLFEIERIISRTVTYALVAGLLAGLVAIVATVIGTRFTDPLVVAGTTLVMAALFSPVRRRVQRVVDRRFNRSRYDIEQVVTEFSGSLGQRVDGDVVIDDWLAVVSETMQPVRVAVWVRS